MCDARGGRATRNRREILIRGNYFEIERRRWRPWWVSAASSIRSPVSWFCAFNDWCRRAFGDKRRTISGNRSQVDCSREVRGGRTADRSVEEDNGWEIPHPWRFFRIYFGKNDAATTHKVPRTPSGTSSVFPPWGAFSPKDEERELRHDSRSLALLVPLFSLLGHFLERSRESRLLFSEVSNASSLACPFPTEVQSLAIDVTLTVPMTSRTSRMIQWHYSAR